MSQKPCKDCLAEGVPTVRPSPHPGPRCYTHWRQVSKARRVTAHARRVQSNFGLTQQQYWSLYESQGGSCYICQRATGRTKRLAVDHDHGCAQGHPPDQGCPRCVRALLCGPCNQMLGRCGVEALGRAIKVLTDPPAQATLRQKVI